MSSAIAEIYVLGTGGKYGESIILNLCNDNWAIIDSCKNPNSGEILPLEFIKNKKIKPEQIKFILCSHWHDDHINGLSDVFEYSIDADFIFTRITDQKKFLQMVSLDHTKSNYPATKSSTKEFMKCYDILKKRDKIYQNASSDRLLYVDNVDSHSIEIISLSPSDQTSHNFDKEISLLMSDYMSTNKTIPDVNPNHRSIVLLLKIGEHNAILGSDLEKTSHDRTGWNDILNHSKYYRLINDANYIKIPHHGSENGYVDEMWDFLLVANSTATITPWKKGGNYLPTDNMIALYKSKTDELYLTNSHNQSKKPKKRDRDEEKTLKTLKPSLSEYKYNFGIIKSSIDISQKSSNWQNEVVGTALKY